VVADQLDVEEVLDTELGDDALGDLHQPVILERLEVHREPGPHRLACLCMSEQDLARAGDPVHGSLSTLRELHHQEIRPALFGQELHDVLEAHREIAGALLDQLFRAVDGRVQDAKAA
jgi:hypothetical protein